MEILNRNNCKHYVTCHHHVLIAIPLLSGDNQHPRGVSSCHQQGLRRHANEQNISQTDGKDGPKAIQEIPSRQKREESDVSTSTEGVHYSITKSWYQSLNQWASLSTHMIPV